MQSGSTSLESSVLFPRKFADIKTNPLLWNKEWNKELRSISARDVYATLSKLWKCDEWTVSKMKSAVESLKRITLQMQSVLSSFWEKVCGDDNFVATWLLVQETDRRGYLLKGLETACRHASWHQDGRALCPEIRINLLLKTSGKAFVKLMTDYCKGIKEAGENTIYHLPSKWWDKAINPSKATAQDSAVFATLTVQRDEFISRFLMYSGMELLQDLAFGSNRTDPVLDIVRPAFGYSISKTAVMARAKPMIRCENCTKRPEDIGGDVKFMVCSVCRAKLNFTVHYCSHACQKEDWREHKKICGSRKATKMLPGTARDPLWQFPECPEFVHGMLSVAKPGETEGSLPITEMGFGILHPSRTHSVALHTQLFLLENDKSVDYFIYDEKYCPVPLVIDSIGLKLSFRTMRSDAIFSENQQGLGALLEYLVKEAQEMPGFNRHVVLSQLSAEYEVDVEAKVEEFVKDGARRMKDYPEVKTRLEVMGLLLEQSWSRMSKIVD